MVDYRREGDVLLRELINEKAGLPEPVDASNLIFGQSSLLLTEPRGTANVGIRGVENTMYRPAPTRIYYHRLDLGVLFQGTYTPRFQALGQSDLHRLLPDLNKALGTGFTKDDLQNINIGLLGEGDEISLELRATPGSLAYRGMTRVVFDRKRLMLTDMVTETILDPELQHPDGFVPGLKSASLNTWGLDFTLIWELLNVNRNAVYRRGQFRRLTELREALSNEYGLDNWPGNNTAADAISRVTLYDTRQVPKANTDFQFVVVQTGIRDNGYLGTAYFHFNRPL